MTNRERELESRIREYEDRLRDPYEQDKWVEREQIERDQAELRRIRSK